MTNVKGAHVVQAFTGAEFVMLACFSGQPPQAIDQAVPTGCSSTASANKAPAAMFLGFAIEQVLKHYI
ncbi:MAG: hypothetical protein ACRETW_15180 [Stenotrophobium sp.]